MSYKTSFLLVKNMRQQVILRTPFIQLIQPFTVTNEGIETHALNRKITFNFITKPQKRSLNILQEHSISEINCLIKDKENQLEFLKEDLEFKRIEENLIKPNIIEKIASLQKHIEKTDKIFYVNSYSTQCLLGKKKA